MLFRSRVKDRPCIVVLEKHEKAARGYLADAVERRNLFMAEGDGPVRAAKDLVRYLRKHRWLRVITSALHIHDEATPRKAMARECGRACAIIGAEVARRRPA